MGKHRNHTQNQLFIEFMEKNTDIAKGFTQRDKVLVQSLWQELAESLNAAGPPNKDVNAWKKIWTEWKSEIKKKLSDKKNEKQFHLTQTEEAVVRLCGIRTTLGATLAPAALIVLNDSDTTCSDMATSSSKRKLESPNNFNTPRITKTDRKADRLEKLDQILVLQKENAASLKRICHAIEKSNDCQQSIANAVNDLKNEFVSSSSRMLNIMQEKNEIKKQQLELDLLKLKFARNIQ